MKKERLTESFKKISENNIRCLKEVFISGEGYYSPEEYMPPLMEEEADDYLARLADEAVEGLMILLDKDSEDYLYPIGYVNDPAESWEIYDHETKTLYTYNVKDDCITNEEENYQADESVINDIEWCLSDPGREAYKDMVAQYGPEPKDFKESFKKISEMIEDGAFICNHCGKSMLPDEIAFEGKDIMGNTVHICSKCDDEVRQDNEEWLDDMSDEEVDAYIEKYGPIPEEDPADRDMGEMYGFYNGFREAYVDDRKAWIDAKQKEKDIRNSNYEKIFDIKYDMDSSFNCERGIDEVADALKGVGKGIRRYVNGYKDSLFRKIAGIVISAAPELVSDILAGSLSLINLPIKIRNEEARNEIERLKLEIADAQDSSSAAHKKAVDSYNKEYQDLTIGAKVRVKKGDSTRVATIVKQNPSGTYQVKGVKGEKYSVPASDIVPYTLHSDFNKTFKESLRFPAEHYASEALKDLIGKYSRMEYEAMGEDDKYEACFDAALSYVDGDSDNFDSEAQSIADILYDKMEKGAFNEASAYYKYGAVAMLAIAIGIKSCNVKVADNALDDLGSSDNYYKYNQDKKGKLLFDTDTHQKAMYAAIVENARNEGISIEESAKTIMNSLGKKLKQNYSSVNNFANLPSTIENVSVGKSSDGQRLVRVDFSWKQSHHSGSGENSHTYYTTEHGQVYIPESEANQYGIEDINDNGHHSVNIGGTSFEFDESKKRISKLSPNERGLMNYRKIYEAGQNERLIEGLGDFFSSGAKELVRNITNSESKEYDGRVSELGELVYSKMFAVNDNNVFDALMKLNKNTDFSSASATEIEYKIENDRVICYVPLHLAGTSRKQKFYTSAPLSSLVVQYLKGIDQLKLLQKISHSFDCLDYDEVGDATKKDFITDIASQVEVLKKHELNKRLNNKASKDTRKQSKEDNHKSLLKQFESKKNLKEMITPNEGLSFDIGEEFDDFTNNHYMIMDTHVPEKYNWGFRVCEIYNDAEHTRLVRDCQEFAKSKGIVLDHATRSYMDWSDCYFVTPEKSKENRERDMENYFAQYGTARE